ncbi:MAG: hypothetical protein JAY66_24310 [Candidatus Thiodiazotropha taylori]|nr:hypothetical protein [Candidatus Thiodiazotropha taylori]
MHPKGIHTVEACQGVAFFDELLLGLRSGRWRTYTRTAMAGLASLPAGNGNMIASLRVRLEYSTSRRIRVQPARGVPRWVVKVSTPSRPGLQGRAAFTYLTEINSRIRDIS